MDEQTNEVMRKLNLLLDEKNGLKISGNGIICNNLEKMLEKLVQIEKKMYFMEQRQKEMFEFQKAKG
jgi:hypothetical protein